MHYEIMWNAFILQQEAETTDGKYEVDADKTLQSETIVCRTESVFLLPTEHFLKMFHVISIVWNEMYK